MTPSSRGREVARGVVRSSPRPEKSSIFCDRRGIETFFGCFLLTSTQMYLYQTPGPRPPRITGRVVNTVTRGWVRAPNERAPFTFYGAVVGFVHRCLSRTRNLAASKYHLADFSQADPSPTSAHVGTCFVNIRDHSERYRKRIAGIFETQTCFGNIAFPLSSV